MAQPDRVRRWEWALVLLLAVPGIDSLLYPLEHGLDPSMFYMFADMTRLGVSHGGDLLYAFGPLAFLDQPNPVTPPGQTWLAVAYKLGVGVSLPLLWFDLSRRTASGALPRWLTFLLITRFFLAVSSPHQVLPTSLSVALVLVLAAHLIIAGAGPIRALLLGALVAVLLLYKLGVGLIALGPLGLACVAMAWERRFGSLALCLLGGLTTGIVAWVIFAGPDPSFSRYLSTGLHMAANYGEVARLDHPPLEAAAFGLVGFSALVSVIALGSSWLRRDHRQALVAMVAGAGAYYFFRHAIVRCDHGHLRDALGLGLCTAVTLAARGARWDRWLLPRVLGIQAVFCVVVLAMVGAPINGSAMVAQLWQRPLTLVGHAFGLIKLDEWRALALQSFAQGPKQVAPEHAAAIGFNPVDIYPHEFTELLAAGLHWQPRPIPQSHATYAPELDELNAQALAATGPPFVLFGAKTIDRRYRWTDEPQSLLVMRAHYSVHSVRAPYVLMQRTAARPIRATHVAAGVANLGEWLEVPAGEDLFLAVEPTRTLRGQVARWLLRDAIWSLEFADEGGNVMKFRAVRANLQSGVYLSRLVVSLGDWAAWFGGDHEALRRIVKVRIDADPTGCYAPQFALRWEQRRVE